MFPTNALILLSNDELKKQLFPYAKIECARFKGTIPGDFIDQKTIDSPLSLQAEEAYKFILRHIAQGSTYEGVYRKDRWEYPVIAIREVIRNAVIHRDYALKGMDVKIAVFDDKIEITSPGKLMPTIDFNDMEAGQSDIRNKILAGVFKKLGIIEQWGNGLRLIAEELKKYPEIKMQWSEPGMAFRITFIKSDFYLAETGENGRKRTKTDENGRKRTKTTKYEQLTFEEQKVLSYLAEKDAITRTGVMELLNIQKTKAHKILSLLVKKGLIEPHGRGRGTYYILRTE